jgi:signal transduction histidine kinase
MRQRITRMTVVVTAVAVLLLATPLTAVVGAYLVADERAELRRAAEVAAIGAGTQLASRRPVTSLTGAAHAPAAVLALYDADGRRILGDGPARADAVVQAAAATAEPGSTDGTVGGDLVVAVPVDTDTTPALTVRAAISRWDVYRRLGLVGLGMAALAAVAAVAAGLLARRLAQRITRPLEDLAAAARRLGEGDFTVRGPTGAIPEIDAVSDALTETADRIDRALARERAFSVDSSHQLRTPLAGLKLGLETALELPPGSDLRPALAAAIDAADRLETTIADLIDLARDTHHTAGPLDLPRLLDETAEAWHDVFAAAGRTLTVHQDDVPPTHVAAGAIRQILTVLLDNAMNHGRGPVTLAARDASGVLALDVTDAGPGPQDPATLFVRRAPGSTRNGIGLALARRLAEAEGGRLVLTTPVPPTFTLLLPAAARDSASARLNMVSVG